MDNFEKAIEMIKSLQNNLYTAYQYFSIWETFQKAKAPNIVWEDLAEKNVKIMNKFKRFFAPTIEANRKTFILELAKIFDKNKESISLYKLLNFIQSNINSFNKDSFVTYNKKKNRNIYDLENTYKPITNKELNDIKDEIKWKNDLIEKLRNYRSKNLAHNDIKKENIELIVWEIDELFKKTQKRLNHIWNQINHETYQELWKEKYTEESVYAMIDRLKRFEPYRKKEIEKEIQKQLAKEHLI